MHTKLCNMNSNDKVIVCHKDDNNTYKVNIIGQTDKWSGTIYCDTDIPIGSELYICFVSSSCGKINVYWGTLHMNNVLLVNKNGTNVKIQRISLKDFDLLNSGKINIPRSILKLLNNKEA
jgi:hypothetical protein